MDHTDKKVNDFVEEFAKNIKKLKQCTAIVKNASDQIAIDIQHNKVYFKDDILKKCFMTFNKTKKAAYARFHFEDVPIKKPITHTIFQNIKADSMTGKCIYPWLGGSLKRLTAVDLCVEFVQDCNHRTIRNTYVNLLVWKSGISAKAVKIGAKYGSKICPGLGTAFGGIFSTLKFGALIAAVKKDLEERTLRHTSKAAADLLGGWGGARMVAGRLPPGAVTLVLGVFVTFAVAYCAVQMVEGMEKRFDAYNEKEKENVESNSQ